LGVAVLVKIVYAPWFLNYDARYALVWARDIADGLTPDYEGSYAPTPHPLETAASLVAVPFGTGGDALMSWAALLCFGVLVWLAFALGRELFSAPVGVVTALVVLTRPALERDALLGYQDTAFAVVVVWAVLLEARRPKRGTPVLLLLALAGLMRPEAWALAGLYTLYLWRGASGRDRARYAGLTALAPVLWALGDWAVTGDPLHSLHGTADLAETVDRRRDPLTGPYWAAKYLGYTLREPMAIGIPIGLAFAWRHARRARSWLPLAAAVAMLVVFLISPLFGLPLIGRYVRTPAVLLAVYYGVAVFGWQLLPREHRSFWVGAAAVAVVASVVYLPWHAKQLSGLENRLDYQGAYYRDLRAVGQSSAVRGALERCKVIGTADHRPIPHLRWWLESDPGTVAPVAVEAGRRAPLLLLPRRTAQMRRFYRSQFPRVRAPAGFGPLYRNASWRVVGARECAG
jgi:hypothetical protein